MQTILVVEDEYFLADDCASLATKAGFNVAGPFDNIEEAFGALDRVDGALIDINLANIFAYPLLDELLRRKIPIVIYTGYQSLPPQYVHLPCYRKPDDCSKPIEHLRKAVRNVPRNASPFSC